MREKLLWKYERTRHFGFFPWSEYFYVDNKCNQLSFKMDKHLKVENINKPLFKIIKIKINFKYSEKQESWIAIYKIYYIFAVMSKAYIYISGSSPIFEVR